MSSGIEGLIGAVICFSRRPEEHLCHISGGHSSNKKYPSSRPTFPIKSRKENMFLDGLDPTLSST